MFGVLKIMYLIQGFKVGDRVTWYNLGTFKSGVIRSLKDNKVCLVETDNSEIIEKKYDDLTKVN